MTFTISGRNDSANITGPTAGDVTEDGTLTAGGILNANDSDAGENKFQPTFLLDKTYGSFTFNAETGAWGYTLNNVASNVQELREGDIGFEFLNVTSADGSDSEMITVTVHGTNDPATISGDIVGDVAEDGNLVESGVLSVSDVDKDEAKFKTPDASTLQTDYGDFTFDPDTGAWGFTLDNNAVQSIGEFGGTEVGLTVESLDGTDSTSIAIFISGANDPATVSGDTSGDVYEDGTQTDSGTVTVSDVDTGEDEFQVPAGSLTLTYGSFTFDEKTGDWEFTIDNSAAQALVSGESFSQGFTATSLDGTDFKTVTVKVHGLDDQATFSGDLQGVVHEDGAGGSLNASGTIAVHDPDANQEFFDPIDPAHLTGDYGTFTFDENTGDWTYALDNTNTDVQALQDEGTLFDYLHPRSHDGNFAEIMVTIFGTNS